MKKLIILTLICGLFGCSPYRENMGRQVIIEEFKSNEVILAPNCDCKDQWLVRTTNGAIWSVETDSLNGKQITAKSQIFGAVSK